jgi:hypothetical protein
VRPLLIYLVLIGLAVHCITLYLYLFQLEIVDLALTKLEKKIESRTSAVNGYKNGIIQSRSIITDVSYSSPKWKSYPNIYNIPKSEVKVRGVLYSSLPLALENLKDNDIMYIGEGIYKTPIVLKHNNVTIIGSGKVVFDNAIAEGKAAIVVKSKNATIHNIECQNIRVRDQNGACIRSEGEYLTIDHVYAHDSQQGVLATNNQVQLNIIDSRFENLGYRGKAHGIYIAGQELNVTNSAFLSSKSEGHEIKSRAVRTVIKNSVIASLSGKDSYLIDIPNGGELVLENNVLQQGPNSYNSTAIAFGLEKVSHHNYNKINMLDNYIILERQRENMLLNYNSTILSEILIKGNTIISSQTSTNDDGNLYFKSRAEAGLNQYPSTNTTMKFPA